VIPPASASRKFAPCVELAADPHLALRRVEQAGDAGQQRRLAGAVGPDEPHLLPLLDAQRSVDEQDLMAVLLADVIETNHEARAAGGFSGLPASYTAVMASAAKKFTGPHPAPADHPVPRGAAGTHRASNAAARRNAVRRDAVRRRAFTSVP